MKLKPREHFDSKTVSDQVPNFAVKYASGL